MVSRPGSRRKGHKRSRKVRCPCCKGAKRLYVWHPDESIPRSEPCIHCEEKGEIEIDIMGQISRGME
jgi:hypothetical protein